MNVGIVSMLAAAVLGLAVLPAPAAADPSPSDGSFAWTIDCRGTRGFASVGWVWLDNDVVIADAGGSAGCSWDSSGAGSGTRPSNATGFTANLCAYAVSWGGYISDCHSVTKSFALGKGFKAQLTASASFNEPGRCSDFCFGDANEHAKFVFDG